MSKASYSTVKEGGKILLVLLVNMSDSQVEPFLCEDSSRRNESTSWCSWEFGTLKLAFLERTCHTIIRVRYKYLILFLTERTEKAAEGL